MSQNDPIVIVAAKRTAIGTLGGGLSPLSAHELGAQVIKHVLADAKLKADEVDEVLLGQVLTAAMAGYALSKLRVRGANAWMLLFLTSLMVPVELLVLPLYLIMKHFPLGPGHPGVNLLDSYWGLILPSVFSAFAVFVAKDAMDSVPSEILDAARIDGCGEMRVFWKFALPMVKPALAILGVFAFVTSWNSFFWPLIVINNPDFYPLVLGVQKLIDTGEPLNVVLAALSLSTIPSLVLLILFQRTLIRGIAYTGLFG